LKAPFIDFAGSEHYGSDRFESVGDLAWRECVSGLETAKEALHDFASKSENEFQPKHTATKEIFAA
jgi:hypothetical protein